MKNEESTTTYYSFEREAEYLQLLKAKVQNAGDAEAREHRFVQKVRKDVKRRLEALTR